MSDSDFGNLGDVVAEVLDTKHDRILHILVLTYEFDEQQLLNLVCGRTLEDDFELRQKQLKLLADLRPIVIYDARKTGACSKLPQFLELHPFKAAGYACHHAKGYLIVTEKTVRLVLGSFNLTRTGLFHNREVLESFYWDAQSTKSLNILAEWTSFLEQAYGQKLADSTGSAFANVLATLNARLVAWKTDGVDDDLHLLASGYGGQAGLNALRAHWDRWFPGTEPTAAFAVSPFFDSAPQNGSFAASLHQRFPHIEALTIVTDELRVPQFSQAHFGPVRKRTLWAIPKVLSEAERSRIESAARQSHMSSKDQAIVRSLHAKVLLLQSESGCLAYIGSANFTRKAWEGSNQELGLVWKADDGNALQALLVRNLSVEKRDLAVSLPPEPAPGAAGEDEEYAGNPHFPEFIAGIRLMPDEEIAHVRFEFDVSSTVEGPEPLRDYQVEWGGLALCISDACSQWIPRESFQARLIGARNLKLTHCQPDSKPVWLPFRYAGQLVAERETFLHPSSLDWMEYYLDPNRDWPGEPGECLPGEGGWSDGQQILPAADVVNRADNCVVAMQAYLNLFSRVERDFRKRLTEILALPAEQHAQRLTLDIVQPLASLGTLLERESTAAAGDGAQAKTVSQSDIFKTGELALFIDALADQAGPGLSGSFESVRDRLHCILQRWRGTRVEQIQARYIDFVLQKEVV